MDPNPFAPPPTDDDREWEYYDRSNRNLTAAVAVAAASFLGFTIMGAIDVILEESNAFVARGYHGFWPTLRIVYCSVAAAYLVPFAIALLGTCIYELKKR